jgi:phospholipid/cholesterol/gamma-HCH transport system substrate-binding protein
MRRLFRSAVGALVGVVLLSSCAALNINSIPLPGNSYEGGYDIVLQFANVLNLPDRAKVVMDGATVGVVSKVVVAGDQVDVTARVAKDVQVPSDTTAVLQQATVLGDIYVALNRRQVAAAPAPLLRAGGTIPLAQTTSPPQLEDTIANLANFIGSGSIQRAQNTIVTINGVTPPKDEVRRLVSRVTEDLGELSDNVDTVETLLHGVSDTSTVLATRAPALSVWFSPKGVQGFKRDMVPADTMGRLLPSVGSIYNGGYWLAPLLGSLGTAFGAVQSSKQAVEREYPLYRQFINDYFLQQEKYPAINITSVVGPDGRELSGNVEQVLRMLGAVP